MLLDASQEVCEGGGGGEYLPTVGITVGAPLPAVCHFTAAPSILQPWPHFLVVLYPSR